MDEEQTLMSHGKYVPTVTDEVVLWKFYEEEISHDNHVYSLR